MGYGTAELPAAATCQLAVDPARAGRAALPGWRARSGQSALSLVDRDDPEPADRLVAAAESVQLRDVGAGQPGRVVEQEDGLVPAPKRERCRARGTTECCARTPARSPPARGTGPATGRCALLARSASWSPAPARSWPGRRPLRRSARRRASAGRSCRRWTAPCTGASAPPGARRRRLPGSCRR